MMVPSPDDKSWDVKNIANALNLPSQMRYNRRKLFRCVIYHLRDLIAKIRAFLRVFDFRVAGVVGGWI